MLNGIALALLLGCSALVSGAEAAFFSISSKQLAHCKANADARGHRVLTLLQDSKRLLATVLIINSLVNVAFIVLSTYMLWQILGAQYIDNLAMALYTVLSTGLIVLFGEVVPKMYATRYPLAVALHTAPLINTANQFLWPITSLLLSIQRVLGRDAPRAGYDLSSQKLQKALELTTDRSASADEKEILKDIVAFGSFTAKQIMQPRTSITAVSNKERFSVLLDIIHESGYSRLPVYEETIDHIQGILYAKDLIPHLHEHSDFAWQGLLRKCLFVPENKKLDALLLEFQEKHIHLAIVVDEYGGTSGLITMEDIFEQVIGEITDEFDQYEISYQRIGPNTFVFEGKTPLHDVCKVLDQEITVFESIKGESESLGGLILEIHGQLPQVGVEMRYRHFLFKVVAGDERKIQRVQVQVFPPQSTGIELT